MQRYFLTLATSSLLLGFHSGSALAQEGELSEEQSQQVENLTGEIERLTQELNTLKGQLDSDQNAETVQEEVKKVEEAAGDIVKSAEDVEKGLKLWSGDMELGYVDVSGNTNETSIKSRADVTRERDRWRFTIFYDSLNTKAEDERTAEKYFYSNRLAYAYTKHNYAFGYASYEDDRFSGYDYRATASGGYGRRIYNEEDFKWDIEVGPGYRYSKLDEESGSDETEELILRAFTKIDWAISDTTDFSQSLSVESGDDSTVSKSITALKSRINGYFSLKISYTVKYTDSVPDDKKHADEETALTLTYSF